MPSQKALIPKRRNYFIDREFQSRFILKFCLLIAAGGLLTIGILYLLAMRSTTVSIVDSRVVVRTTADFILPLLIQTVAVVTVFIGLAVIIVTLFVSHKIAGPLYRFKKVIDGLSEGDFSSEFRIRKLDQLQDLSDSLNNMIAKLKTDLRGFKDNVALLKKRAEELPDTEIKRTTQELNKIIERFKI